MREVEVRVLGPVELRVDGLLAPVERVQVRRMLAVLAMSAGRSMSTDGLIEELWPGDQPKSPRAAVRVVASRLRAALGAHASTLRSSGHEYLLDIDDGAVDAWSFTALVAAPQDGQPPATVLARLDAAFDLWRGDPFGGAKGPPALDRAAIVLDQLRLAAIVRRAELLVDAGSADRAIAAVAPLISDETIDERLWAVHAIALAHAGRRIEALAVLRRAADVLRDRHGLASAEVLANAELVVTATGREDIRRPVPVSVPSTLLVGRDEELTAALQWLTRRAESPPCVLLVGEAGAGKSTLATAIAARLGWPAVEAQCDPDLADSEGLVSVLGVEGAMPTSGSARSRAIGVVDELVNEVAARSSSGPLLIILDDIHGAGEVELRFLLRLVRSPRLREIGIVATLRPTGQDLDDARARGLIAKVEQHGNVCRVALGGLDRTASRRAYATACGRTLTPFETSTLMELTAGNPYLIRALAAGGLDLHSLRADAVRRLLRDVTIARVTVLDGADDVVLTTAAVLGRNIDLSLVGAACGRDDQVVADTLDHAFTAGLVVADGPNLRFDHELTRLGLAAAVGPAASAALHAAATVAARALDRDPVVVARHILGAGTLQRGARDAAELLVGADRAAARGSFDDAIRFLAAAGELERDPERSLDIKREHAWALECSGDPAGANAVYDEVFDAAGEGRYRSTFGRAALGGAAFGGIVGGNWRRIERLMESLEDPPPDERLHLEIAIAALTELELADRPVPPELDDLVVRLAADDDAGPLRDVVGLRRRVRGPISTELVDEVEDHLRSARRVGDVPLILDAAEMLVCAHLVLGDLSATEGALTDLARTVRTHRWPRYVWTVALFEAVVADLRHGPGAADELARRAMIIGREHGLADATNAYSMFRLSVALRDGTLPDVVQLARQAVAAPGAPPAWCAILAASLAASGDVAGTDAALARFWGATGDGWPSFTHIGLTLAAHAGRLIGDATTVQACIDRLLPWSGNLIVVGAGAACFGAADTVLATAMAAVGDPRADGYAERGRRLSGPVEVGSLRGALQLDLRDDP